MASRIALNVVIASVITFITLNLNLFRLEAYFYDARMQLVGSEKIHPDILLLALGETEGEEAHPEIYTMESHLKVLEALIAQNPKAIVYLNHFDVSDVDTKLQIAENFVSVANKAMDKGIKIYFGSDISFVEGEVLPPYPLSLLPHFPSVLHKDGTIFGEDKVMRRALLTTLDQPSVHMRVAFPDLTVDQLKEKAKTLRGAYYFRPADAWHVLTKYPSDTSFKNNAYPKVFFSEVLDGDAAKKAAGKIVLIDSQRKDFSDDFAFTPYSRITYTHPRINVHGAILDTLLKNNGLIRISNWVDTAITFILALVLCFITTSMSPTRGVTSVLLTSLGVFVASLALFKFGFWMRLVHPLFSMFFTYYLIVPYRAILEYKKRWEVQEKHDLLVQVEEMKGNFLSLMSHDLKTPVARIQGLAEMVLRQGGLNAEQKSEMNQIISSTERLDKFISKILNLTKVESNEVKLNKKSKDINKILDQCVEKLEFQAKSKDISVELHLEPLFPIQLDAALLNQVFTNLIDNAIKYSTPGARVEICSREVGDYVEITVQDNGPGLDKEEMQQLFTKFFRGKTHPGDETKGSGLGLYLSKYFIELHRGTLRAESELGKGCKFIIQLPIQLEASKGEQYV